MNNQGSGSGGSGRGTFGEEASAIGDRVSGNVKDAYGAVTGNESVEREGEAQANYGAQRQSNNRILTGMFRDRESAERAYNSVTSRGYTNDDVNLMMTDETRSKYFSDADAGDEGLGSKALEGAGAGSAIGGTLGAIIGGIAAIGTNVLLPGLGLVVAGPLAAALAGAGAGGLTGGLVGALVGSGIPEDRAKEYEEGVKSGGIVMGVNPRSDEDAEYFENEWRNHRGENIYR
ncbi:MAG TPA: CsbD family protein [Pyrinomonadaceae bacterium]